MNYMRPFRALLTARLIYFERVPCTVIMLVRLERPLRSYRAIPVRQIRLKISLIYAEVSSNFKAKNRRSLYSSVMSLPPLFVKTSSISAIASPSNVFPALTALLE